MINDFFSICEKPFISKDELWLLFLGWFLRLKRALVRKCVVQKLDFQVPKEKDELFLVLIKTRDVFLLSA